MVVQKFTIKEVEKKYFIKPEPVAFGDLLSQNLK